MFIVTTVLEDLERTTRVFEEAQIPVFSVMDMIGHKSEDHNYLLESWFARSAEQTSSLFFFSFTSDDKAANAMKLIEKANAVKPDGFPMRAFILPVESSSH